MKKSLIIIAILIMALTMACSITAICYAEGADDVSMTETDSSETWFNMLWNKVEPAVMGAVSGISLGGIISAVFYALIKAQTNKTLTKLNDTAVVDKQTKEVVGGVIDAIANTTLSMNIQPVVESKLKVITETIYNDLEKANIEREQKDLAVVEILSALANYFDNSIGVSDECKLALKQAIADAKALYNDVKVPQVQIETKEIVVSVDPEINVVENY